MPNSNSSLPHAAMDFIFLALAACYAVAVCNGVLDISANGAVIDSDLATYAQIMAGAANPEMFAADPVLHAVTPGNSIWNVQRWLAETFGNSATPAVALLQVGALTVFMWLVSFYLLGRWLFTRPSLAALTSLLMSITVYMEWGTFWGVLHSDPLPRVFYGAIWPFLLMGCIAGLRISWLRPLVMLATGASMWIHGVNALACGAMFFLAYLCHKPKDMVWGRHMLWCLFSLILYFLPVLAFLWPTFTPRSFTADDLAIFRDVFLLRWQEDYGNLPERIGHLVRPSHFASILWLLVPGCAGWLIVLLRGQGHILLLARCYPTFLLALACVVGFSATESFWAQTNGRLPLGHELVRGMRYLIPLSWLMVAGAIATLVPAPKPHAKTKIANNVLNLLVLALALSIFCTAQDRQNVAAQHAFNEITGLSLPLKEQALSARADALKYRDVMEHVSKIVPVGEAVFSDGEDMAVRYLAKRPLVHTFKDGFAHYYGRDPDACRQWLAYTKMMDKAKDGNITSIVDAWLMSHANWILFQRKDLLPLVEQHGNIVWQKNGWSIARRKM